MAVRRNALKRVARETFRLIHAELMTGDYLVGFHETALQAPSARLRMELKRAFMRFEAEEKK